MKFSASLTPLLFFSVVVAVGRSGEPVDAANRLTDDERTGGWQMLWDGKTLAGWHGTDASVPVAERWKAVDGVLSVVAGGPGATRKHLVTAREYAAFELAFEFKLSAGANSGVKYLVTIEKNGDRLVPIGPEYQILDDDRHPDAKKGENGNRTLGSFYDVIARRTRPAPPGGGPLVNTWQQGRIVVRPDGTVEHWLNGEKIVAYVRGSPDFKARVARSAYAKFPGFGEVSTGLILLQDHGDAVAFRSIKLRLLHD